MLAVALAVVASFITPVAAAPTADGVHLSVRHVKAAGTTFAYAELGSGVPLLLLNGTGSPMNEWDPELLGALQEAHRVIVLDYPGLGLSGPAPARWTFANAADWVSQFVAALEPSDPVDVLGWSMGGFVAQQLAVRHPERVRSLVLAATNPGGPRATLGPRWVQRLDSQAHESGGAYLRTNYPATAAAQAAGRSFLARLVHAVDTGAYPVESVPASTYRAMVRAEDAWLRSPANARALASLSTRTLVMTGAVDIVTPAANSRLIATLIPQARLRLVPGAGHSFLFQDPSGTARTISAFLAAS